MGIFKKDLWEKESKIVEEKEKRFIEKNKKASVSLINQKLAPLVPEKLQKTLNAAFCKAFHIVFEKGTGVIEKTYDKEKSKNAFKLNNYASSLKESKKNCKSFSRQSSSSAKKNLAISVFEGTGLGILGIGLPDIAIFTSVILKSMYETAISYGYSYDTAEEKLFILKVIRASLSRGDELVKANSEINEYIKNKTPFNATEGSLIEEAASTMSCELLYMKFLQGIPIIGIAGGLSNTVYLKKITDYADIKYRKRFLSDRRQKTKKEVIV